MSERIAYVLNSNSSQEIVKEAIDYYQKGGFILCQDSEMIEKVEGLLSDENKANKRICFRCGKELTNTFKLCPTCAQTHEYPSVFSNNSFRI